jgi:hypothetical protein
MQGEVNPYKVETYSKIKLNQNLLDKSDIQHLGNPYNKRSSYQNDTKNQSHDQSSTSLQSY